MKLKYSLIALSLFLVGCSQTASDRAGTFLSEETQLATETTEIHPSPVSASATVAPPAPSPSPTSTQIQTLTPTQTPTPSYNSIGFRDVAIQDRGGVAVEVAWIQIGERQALEQNLADAGYENEENLEEKPVLVWLVFNISNYSGKGFHLHPRRGMVIINEENIDLSTYDTYTDVDDNFDGAYAPGEEVIGGGVWFGLENSTADEIDEIIIQMHGPHFYEEDVYAAEYAIVIDLSDHVSEEVPDYLK